MRLVTRCDLDGLACAVLIGLHEEIDEILLTHPQEIADGKVDIGPDDILANLPFQPGCALWFDHHMHTAAAAPEAPYKGLFGRAPSAARLVFEYYGGLTTMAEFEELVHETDRFDSADLDLDDILDPQGYILLGFTLDARSGLGRTAEYFMTVRELLTERAAIDQVLEHPEVEERCRRLAAEDTELHSALVAHSHVEGNVLITDFRSLDRLPVGNRFLVFALFPQINVAMRIQQDHGRPDVMVTLGHSIVNRSCKVNLGELAARYGGGGHRGAASIQLAGEADAQLRSLVAELRDREPFDFASLGALPPAKPARCDQELETAAALRRLTATEMLRPGERNRPS
ncbi:MAG: exopolyphosphatase [Thermoanaerobaculia bacterium]